MNDRLVTVLSTDGQHSEIFNGGERVKNVMRIGRLFEPVSTYRVVRTYAMDWSEFETSTSAVHEAQAWGGE